MRRWMVGCLSWSVVGLLSACKDAPEGTDDPADEETDVADTDAPAEDATRVTITVLDRASGLPDANEAVIFFLADGTVAAQVDTDASGRASAEIDEGGAVVLMVKWDEDAMPYGAVAWLGVGPGDQLTFEGLGPEADRWFEVDVPAWSGATDYRYSLGCGAEMGWGVASSPRLNTRIGSCATADVLFRAATGSTGHAVFAASDVDTSAPQVLTGDWVAPSPFEVLVTGIGAGATSANVEVWHRLGLASVPGFFYTEGTPSAGRFQASGTMSAFDGLEGEVRLTTTRAGYLNQYTTVVAPYAADLAVDVSALQLPWVTAPTLDPATRVVSWSEDGDGAVDGALLTTALRRDGAVFTW